MNWISAIKWKFHVLFLNFFFVKWTIHKMYDRNTIDTKKNLAWAEGKNCYYLIQGQYTECRLDVLLKIATWRKKKKRYEVQ